jgi:hypothetical protein
MPAGGSLAGWGGVAAGLISPWAGVRPGDRLPWFRGGVVGRRVEDWDDALGPAGGACLHGDDAVRAAVTLGALGGHALARAWG